MSPGFAATVWPCSRLPAAGQGGPDQIKITEATGEDLPAIVGILNDTAANSIARFETQAASVAERRDRFGQFAAAGPYRLVVARGSDQVLGYACSQRYRDLQAFRGPLRSASRLRSAAGGSPAEERPRPAIDRPIRS